MSLLKDIWNAVSGIGKGMQKTYDEQFDPVFTNMYPFVQPDLPPVSVQSLALIQNEDGSDRCVSCLACEKVCPSQVITIERKRNPAGKGFILERFDLDLVNCMYCAACVESCPAQAIVTIQDFELSTPNLQSLKADKAMLDAQGLRARQWYSPKVGVEYREEDPNNPVHGRIVKAPIEEQPGGLQEMEKARLAALNPAPAAAPKAEASSVAPAAEAPKPAPVAPKAEAVSSPAPAAEGDAPRNPKIKRFEPKTSATPAADAPAASSAPAVPSPTAPVTQTPSGTISSEAKPENPKVKRFEPKTPAAPASSEAQGIVSSAPAATKPETPSVTPSVAPTPSQAVSSVTAEAPKTEAPKPEAPKPETPKAETPSGTVSSEAKSTVQDAPVSSVSSAPVEIPKTEIPKADIPKAEIPPAAPTPTPEAPRAAQTPAPSALPAVDDLTLIEGIGPKRAEALVAAGITTFNQLAQADTTKLESIMTGASLSLEPGIETWPVQAEFLVKGDLAGFKAYTDKLVAGRVKKNPKVKRWEPKS